jgi:transposase
LSTKIHIAVDALGNVLRLLFTAGQVHESTRAEALIDGLSAENVIGDKAFVGDQALARFPPLLVDPNRHPERLLRGA